MADQHPEVFDSAVQTTHEWLGAIAEADRLSTFPPNTRTSSSRPSVYFTSARHQHVVLVAGHVLAKLAVAAIPVIIFVTVSVATIAAFVGGYLAALR